VYFEKVNLSLFADEKPLAGRLKSLAERGVYFGTSSWKYEGWLGSIYTPERYNTRGKFSRKKFESECLAEYAETFPVVCGDFSFYQFPSESYWQRLFASAPAGLRFAFKVPEEITVREWPKHARYGARAGNSNESFLNAHLFEAAFLRPLAPYKNRVAAMIFEFGTMAKRHYEGVEPFAEDLRAFLRELPAEWRYSVEIRNKEYLAAPYFEVLRENRTAHVFNAWTRMPELKEQLAIQAAYTADFTIARALLRHGRSYEQAVAQFQPYDRTQDPNPGAREGLKELMERALASGQPALMFVNNRLEGNAPSTIQAVVEGSLG
jgi:uncharacterized protein YecE (DUF72 family)